MGKMLGLDSCVASIKSTRGGFFGSVVSVCVCVYIVKGGNGNIFIVT